jgi:hypothetical protein
MTRGEVEKRVRELTGRTDLTVSDVRPKVNSEGKILAYEVDIR